MPTPKDQQQKLAAQRAAKPGQQSFETARTAPADPEPLVRDPKPDLESVMAAESIVGEQARAVMASCRALMIALSGLQHARMRFAGIDPNAARGLTPEESDVQRQAETFGRMSVGGDGFVRPAPAGDTTTT